MRGHNISIEFERELAQEFAQCGEITTPASVPNQEEAALRAEKQRQATRRAQDLLLSKLDETQRRSFLASGEFTVKSKACPGLEYELTSTYTFNINIKLFGKPIGRFCVSVAKTGETPIGDLLLAQKLMLETDEERFIRTGNT